MKFPQNYLDEDAWTIECPEIMSLKEKIESKGVLIKNLKKWDIEIFRGLLTGYNEAFVIDTPTKNQICLEDRNSLDIIKPIIRGRDIDRYHHRWSDLWIINAHNGYLENGTRIPPINVKQDYPAVYRFLFDKDKETGGKVKKRFDQGKHWTNLRNCAFMEHFKGEKILWIELTNTNKFCYSSNEEYILAGAFLMTGKCLKYLLAFLNSKLCKFYFNLISNSSGMATVQWKKFALERMPINDISIEQQKPFIELVDKILHITKDDAYVGKQAKIGKLEKEIDQLIYNLYELTPDEISIVENFNEK